MSIMQEFARLWTVYNTPITACTTCCNMQNFNFWLFNSIQHSPSREANSSSASQKTPCTFGNPQSSLPCLHQPAISPYSEPYGCIPHTPIPSKVHFNIILQSTPRYSKSNLSFRCLCSVLFLPYVLHAPPISPFSIYYYHNKRILFAYMLLTGWPLWWGYNVFSVRQVINF